MNTQPNLKGLPLPLKALLSAYLLTMSIGFAISLLYLFLMDVEPHLKMGMDVLQGTIHKHDGRRGDTRLEGVLRGSMGQYLSDPEKKRVFEWVEGGATAEDFPHIKSIIDKNCVSCHSLAAGLGIVPLATFEEVKAVTNVDLGESIKTMARVSHVHLFGITFIFLSTGLIFSLSSINKYRKLVIILIPFIAIWLEIGSWWLTKYKPAFAYTVIIGGALMGVSFGVQITISLYEMWLRKTRLPRKMRQ